MTDDLRTFTIRKSDFEPLEYLNLLRKLIFLDSMDVVYFSTSGKDSKDAEVTYFCSQRAVSIKPEEVSLVYLLFRKYGFLTEEIWKYYKEGCVGDIPEQATLHNFMQFEEGLKTIKATLG
jgi:hypothetical protein